MPLFEFRCRECSELFEELVGHGDILDDGRVRGVVCAECGSRDVERQLAAFQTASASRSSSSSAGRDSPGGGCCGGGCGCR